MSQALAKAASGEWYDCLDPALEEERVLTRRAVHQHSTMDPDQRGACGPLLAARLGSLADTAWIEAPFHASYALNTHLGPHVYLNAGCVILDSARVEIRGHTMLGPGVHIYCADHHRDPERRAEGIERALPVTIGQGVWIGGGAQIMQGVSIGDNAIVAAGAVVTRDVAAGASVAGVPAREIARRPD